ncbi:unnamed protein product [Allacma fusca]|uniref:Gustatory receptor n=1 Tax=Allacma fusca TaxID=39272 RepID=A0A8J2PWQ7_9HEXA|nr:unnamed protein product [Allacma fusca]
MMILNGLFEVYWPQKLFNVEDQMLRPVHSHTSAREVKKFYYIAYFMFPTIRLIVIVHQMMNIKGTVNHLNVISGLANDLQTYCTGQCSNFSSKIRRNSLRIVAMFVGIPLVTVFPAIVYSFSNGLVLGPMVMREVIIVLVPLQLLGIYFDDGDFIIQCDIVSEFYRQIEMHLVDKEEYLRANHGSVRLVEVRKWHQFLRRNRKMVGQIGSITKVPQLLYLLEVSLNLTVFFYRVLNLVTSPNTSFLESRFLKMSVGYVVACLIRLHVKTLKAEQVTAAEGRVHDALFALNELPQALEVQLELQGMSNTISFTPSRITFGNYVVLHKGVILTISTQVITYLIILLQFDSATKECLH